MRLHVSRMARAVLFTALAGCGTDRIPTGPAERAAVSPAIVSVPVTKTVTSEANDGPGSLREAVTTAVAGDVIGFSPSVNSITLTAQLEVSVPLTIQGPAARVTLNGNDATRLINVTGLAPLTLRHLTLTRGRSAAPGGAVFAFSSPVVLEGVVVSHNQANYGGGVAAASVEMTETVFSDNRADLDGGAVNVNTFVKSTASQLLRNAAGRNGGAMFLFNGTSLVGGTRFEGNQAGASGGAISALEGALAVSGGTFIDNAAAGDGGAIRAAEVNPMNISVAGSTFTGNTATGNAGAVFVNGGATVTASTFRGNAAGGSGGGLHHTNGKALVNGSTFALNTAARGAGLASTLSELTLSSSQFTENAATNSGGGLLAGIVALPTTTILSSNTFTKNTAAGSGGGMFAFGTVSAALNRFVSNSAANGGGVFARDGQVLFKDSEFEQNDALVGAGMTVSASPLTLRTSTFVNNASRNHGGGLAVFSASSTTIDNATFTGNTAASVGGAVYAEESHVVMTHVTLANNTAPNGGGTGSTNQGSFAIRNSIIVGSSCGIGAGLTLFSDFKNRTDNGSCGAAGFSIFGPTPLLALSDNGGPTRTMALPFGSPAVDAGTSCPLATDQRGVTRPTFLSCDLGAYELDTQTTATLAIDPSGTVNSSTGVAYLSGTITCSQTATVTLAVRGAQDRKVGKVNTTIEAASTMTMPCGPAARAWAAVLTPATGAFGISPMTVTAQTAATDVYTAPASVTRSGVKLAWSRR